MVTVINHNFIYLGNRAPVDTDESDWLAENAASLLGTYDALSIVAVSQTDGDDDGIICDDEYNPGNDQVSYDLGGGTVTVPVDAAMSFTANVTLGDGSVVTGEFMVIQTTDGDLFLRHMTSPGSPSLDGLSIQSIELTGVVISNASGYLANESIDNARIVCFVAGTRIATLHGACAVEDLRPGMLVETLNRGPQPVVWVNATRLDRAGRHAPVVIARSALAPGVPACDLRVSPQHRILLRSRIALAMFGADEVFVNAKSLVASGAATRAAEAEPVSYHHFVCPRHEVVLANGAAAETFFPGPEAMAALDRPARAALRLADLTPPCATDPLGGLARLSIAGRARRDMLLRHARHRKPLCTGVRPLTDQPLTVV